MNTLYFDNKIYQYQYVGTLRNKVGELENQQYQEIIPFAKLVKQVTTTSNVHKTAQQRAAAAAMTRIIWRRPVSRAVNQGDGADDDNNNNNDNDGDNVNAVLVLVVNSPQQS